MYAANPEYVKSKYNLPMLREIENCVAEAVEVKIPFMNPITLVFVPRYITVELLIIEPVHRGYCAFTHKAGIHAKAILNNPSTYEILKPEDFGLTRYVSIGHRLTGWNAVKSRVEQLGLTLTDEEVSACASAVYGISSFLRRTPSSILSHAGRSPAFVALWIGASVRHRDLSG